MARSPAIETISGTWLALNIGSVGLTDDQFIRLCRDNGDFHFEMTTGKELIVMTGSNPETDRKNANITCNLAIGQPGMVLACFSARPQFLFYRTAPDEFLMARGCAGGDGINYPGSKSRP
jgi:hypothetical protein